MSKDHKAKKDKASWGDFEMAFLVSFGGSMFFILLMIGLGLMRDKGVF